MAIRQLSRTIFLALASCLFSIGFAANTTTLSPQSQAAKMSVQPTPTFKQLRSHYNKRTNRTIAIYQQYHLGIPILGSEISVRHHGHAATDATLQNPYSASNLASKVVRQINIDANQITIYQEPERLAESLQLAMSRFTDTISSTSTTCTANNAEMVIGVIDKQAILMYRLRFYVETKGQPRRLLTQLVDAAAPDLVYHSIDALQHKRNYLETGPGGNTKTGKYIYGEDDIPALSIKRHEGKCYMQNADITVTDALRVLQKEHQHYPIKYRCARGISDEKCFCTRKPIWLRLFVDLAKIKETLNRDSDAVDVWIEQNMKYAPAHLSIITRKWLLDPRDIQAFTDGQEKWCYCSYSAANDALFFGQTVIGLFNDWYSTRVLEGRLNMRVHAFDQEPYQETGEVAMTGAYWDPAHKDMHFGAGFQDRYYPYVSLDIAAHEIAHGFTQEHADLLYFDETGSLNESFSDMASVAAIAYLRETHPSLYHRLYQCDEMLWTIGASIRITPWDHLQNEQDAANRFDFPLRYYEQPSFDEGSADCFESVPGCVITYAEMKAVAHDMVDAEAQLRCDPDHMTLCKDHLAKSYIVHHGSGIFNKAFYLLANQPNWSVRQAFEVMLTANRDGYWINQGPFNQYGFLQSAACGTLSATHDLNYNVDTVRQVFNQVGLLLEKDVTCQIT